MLRTLKIMEYVALAMAILNAFAVSYSICCGTLVNIVVSIMTEIALILQMCSFIVLAASYK